MKTKYRILDESLSTKDGLPFPMRMPTNYLTLDFLRWEWRFMAREMGLFEVSNFQFYIRLSREAMHRIPFQIVYGEKDNASWWTSMGKQNPGHPANLEKDRLSAEPRFWSKEGGAA